MRVQTMTTSHAVTAPQQIRPQPVAPREAATGLTLAEIRQIVAETIG